MRPNVVVVHTPGLDRLSRVRQADEPTLVQALVAETPIEALRKGILHGLSRFDVLQRDAPTRCPLIQRFPAKLRAVITDNRPREAARLPESLEDLRDSRTGQRMIDFDGGTFTCVLIDDRERANCSSN